MLARTAAGLFWMMRYLERAENTARLVEAGFRMALTRNKSNIDEWGSVVTTAGCRDTYLAKHEKVQADKIVDFVLRDAANTMSVMSSLKAARENARGVRTALTRDCWEAINEGWLTAKDALARSPSQSNLPGILNMLRLMGSQVRGAIYGTMLRNDIFHFVGLGEAIERADNTARILDTKYYVLLPSTASVGSSLDNVQWEMLLRSASAERSFYWVNNGEDVSPAAIAAFLIFDAAMPRSLAFCYDEVTTHLAGLSAHYGGETPAHSLAAEAEAQLTRLSIEDVFDDGLHEFLTQFMTANAKLGTQIEKDYLFYD